MGTALTELNGIGPKTAELFRKIGASSQEELLRTYPRGYDAYEEPVFCGEVMPGEKQAVMGRVSRKPSTRRYGSQSVTILLLSDGTGRLQINWFHMPYISGSLAVGKDYVFRGNIIEKNGRRIMQHPEIYSPEEYRKMCGTMLPVYPLTSGLANRTVRRTVQQVLDRMPAVPEVLPGELLKKHDLVSLDNALRSIHFPQDKEKLLRARRRLVFDEFLFFRLGVSLIGTQLRNEENRFPMRTADKAARVIRELPFSLTGAQGRVWEEIRSDLLGNSLMHRLVQGDVGSGKTILAFLAMLTAFENGWQSALMAPTEVLAAQHFEALCRYLHDWGEENACPVLLTGSCTPAEKRRINEQAASGKSRMIVGTHALIQESVSYADLGLVITDEQHRFGVRQRETLREKGDPPHVLVMSATPIPRTLARMLYGDLDISLLDELPLRRLPVKSCVVGTSYRETAWRFLKKQAEEGHQIYVVCPKIEPGEEMPGENVLEYQAQLQGYMGPGIRVGMLHGRMRSSEKQEVMRAFADGGIRILVSTTVIEVGVDVANATVMMIENAERFGLAQLHQLRGRVGRGTDQSYCIFVQGDGKQETSRRLEILDRSRDGFAIAEEDLKLRGPGDLFGVRQSGLALFQIADIYRDSDILLEADRTAEELLAEDPDLSLPGHAVMRAETERLASFGQNSYDM